LGPVFIDNKYHDIPSTVIAALRTTFDTGASFATVHAANGPDCLKEIAKLENELSLTRPFQVLCVTVLTSFTENNLPSNWQTLSAREHVVLLAQDVVGAGLSGIVCSPEEVSELRKKFSSTYLVTPGIRLPTDAKGDQSRIMGPGEAFAAGASALVVGRPIVEAAEPGKAARLFMNY
jgi:orotidine-5'-phosphate decarboxylase